MAENRHFLETVREEWQKTAVFSPLQTPLQKYFLFIESSCGINNHIQSREY